MAATPVSESADGPVLSLINKRLRALRKKYNRILQMEESVAQGKSLNNEQREVLRSKPSVSAAIDELEKLRQPLSFAVSEEIDLAIQRHRTESLAPDAAAAAVAAAAAADDVASEAAGEEKNGEAQGAEEEGSQPEAFDSMVGDLLNLLYFGALFDVKSQNDFTATMLSRTHERGCCLTYDYVTDDATDLLSERDLDMISTLSGLLISRPVDSSFSHKNALHRCVEHAKLWLANADCPVDNNASISYAGLRERLNKIMASDFFTTSPERKASMEVAAAAAAGNYVHFQVPVRGMPIAVPVQVESHSVEYQPQHGDAANAGGEDVSDDQSNPNEEFHKDEPEMENPEEIVPGEQEEMKPSPEFENTSQQDAESREQQYGNRRNYQQQRGGGRGGSRAGRRGYPNGREARGSGRGGGGYQNGRSNQYYDQPGNYYPRNYNNSRGGRGGSRGGGGAGHPYNNSHGSGNATDMGVAS